MSELKMYRVVAVSTDDSDCMDGAWIMADSRVDAVELFVASATAEAEANGCDEHDENGDYDYLEYWRVQAWEVPARASERGIIEAYVVGLNQAA